MTEIHVVIRRINPAFKIDLVQVGRLKDCQFEPLPLSAIANSPIERFLKSSNICDSPYVDHSDVSNLIAACEGLPGFDIEFFDNTIILIFDFELNCDESTTKKEESGH